MLGQLCTITARCAVHTGCHVQIRKDGSNYAARMQEHRCRVLVCVLMLTNDIMLIVITRSARKLYVSTLFNKGAGVLGKYYDSAFFQEFRLVYF